MSIQSNRNVLVSEVMLSLDYLPKIKERAIFKEAIEEMGRTKLGIVCIINEANKLLGIITDGDIRRRLLRSQKPLAAMFVDDAIKHAILAPATVHPQDSLVNAVELMGIKEIWDLPVLEGNGNLVGLLHLHPAVKKLLRNTD
jgi:DeoR family transcriptional regulator, catabolite repression regulator